MKAIISSTYDDQYFFFVPIVKWCWRKIGVEPIFLFPFSHNYSESDRFGLICKTGDSAFCAAFSAEEHKVPTYAQCSRLYASALDFIPPNEYLIISDIDMVVFNNPFVNIDIAADNDIDIFGADLVPQGQFPMCYIGAKAKTFNRIFNPDNLTLQRCLDNLLGDIECENMRGNFWSKDQETAYNEITKHADHAFLHNRARPGTQFADNRYDRDDAFLLDRLSPNTIDFHMPRPGYEESNFSIILAVLKYHYPLESFDWLVDYRDNYIKLL